MVKLDRFQEIQLQTKKKRKKTMDLMQFCNFFCKSDAERRQIKSDKCFPKV